MSINFVNRATIVFSPWARITKPRACGAGKRWSMTMKEIIVLFFGIFLALNLIHAYGFAAWNYLDVALGIPSTIPRLLPRLLILPISGSRKVFTCFTKLHTTLSYICIVRFFQFTFFFLATVSWAKNRICASGFAPLPIFSNVKLWKMSTVSPRVEIERESIMRRLKNSP